MSGIICCACFDISHFSSTVCSETMAKGSQQDSGEERVTAKSQPIMKSAVERIILDFSKPGEEKLWKSKSLEYNCWERGAIGETRYRHRPKESFRPLLSWAISGKFFLNKLLEVGWWPCLVLSRVENWYWDVRTIGESRWNFLESDTRNSTWFLSRGNSSWWNRAIRCEWGNTSWKTGETRCRFSRSNMASTIRHWKRWSRIRIVSGIKIIREPGEWPSAKKAETNFKCYRRWRETFYDHSISNTTDLTLKQMFDISTKLVSEQDEISGLETIGLENHSWKYLSLTGDERVINLQRTKVYVFSDSVLCLGKIFENSQSNDAWEQKLGWLKIFFKIQKLWQNRRRANGIRVEYFPRIHQYVAAQWRSQTFIVQIRCDTREFHRKNPIYVDVQWHFLWIKSERKRMSDKCQTRISVREEIWKRTMVIYWSWFWQEVVLYQWRQSTGTMGQYGGKDVVGIRRKWMSNFPRYEPIVPRSTQKQRTWKTVDALCSRFVNGWYYLSHNCLWKPA